MSAAKYKRLSISVPPDIAERAKQLDNVSDVCAKAIAIACEALDSGEPQVLQFGFVTTRRLVVEPLGCSEDRE